MFRSPPAPVTIDGYTPRIAATTELIAVLVTDAIERIGDRLFRPRRLDAYDFGGAQLWSCPIAEGAGEPRIDEAGVIWLCEQRALAGYDQQGRRVAEVPVALADDEQLAEFVPLADGFVVAVVSTPAVPIPTGRVLRIHHSGELVWSTGVTAAALAYHGVTQMRADEGWVSRPLDPWQPESWVPVHHTPLAVAGTTVLLGYHEFPRSGIGQRMLLSLATGALLWAEKPGPGSYAAIVGPDAYLLGAQGYGSFSTALLDGGQIVQRWKTHGHFLVTPAEKRAVEMDNVSTAKLHVATLCDDGSVNRGERLPGYYTGGPIALADGSIIMWRGGGLIRVDRAGQITTRQPFGDVKAAAGRMVLNGAGKLAMTLSDDAYGRGSWPLWIFDIDLPPLADGPWPCSGGGCRNVPVLSANLS